MRVMFHILMLAALVLLSIDSRAQTSPPVALECDGCDDAKLQDIAIRSGLGTHFYFDLTLNRMTAWHVTRESGEHGTYLYAVDPLSLEPQYADAFANLSAAASKYGRHFLDSTFTINPTSRWPGFPSRDAGMNAYNVAFFSSAQIDLENWLETLTSPGFSPYLNSLEQTVLGVLGATSGVLFKSDLLTITFNVVLDDGSYVTFTWSAGEKAKFESATDKNGNRIPLTRDQVRGGYRFSGSPNGLTDFVAYITSFGVPVTNGGLTVGTVTVGCVTSSDDAHLSCTAKEF